MKTTNEQTDRGSTDNVSIGILIDEINREGVCESGVPGGEFVVRAAETYARVRQYSPEEMNELKKAAAVAKMIESTLPDEKIMQELDEASSIGDKSEAVTAIQRVIKRIIDTNDAE